MIVFNRVSSVAPGKMASAMAFAKNIASYMNEAYGTDMKLHMPVGGGNPYRIAWTSTFADLAAVDAMQMKTLTDPKFQELLAKNADNFLPGSARDAMWREV